MFEFRSVFPKIAKPESRNYCNESFMLLYSKYCTHFEYPWVCQMPGGREKIDCQMPGGREYFLCKCPGVSRGGMVRVGIERDINEIGLYYYRASLRGIALNRLL